MALPDRLTANQIITSLDKLAVKAPAVTAAYERLGRITAGAQNIEPPRDALFVAVTAALDQGADPAGDAEVQRILTASQIANTGVSQGVDAIVYDQFRAVCTEYADAIIKALAQPFDAAVKTLDTAHGRIGNLPLEDSATILLKGGDIAAVWAEAQGAAGILETVLTAWTAAGEFTRLAPIDPRHAVLRFAAVSCEYASLKWPRLEPL